MNQSGPKATPERRGQRRGIRRVLAVGVLSTAVAAAIVMAVGFASFREFAAGNHLREDLLYSSSIRADLQRIYEDVLSAESGALGYVVTGREEFLVPLESARAVIFEEIQSLAKLAVERPQHATALSELARYVEEEMRLLAEMVETRDRTGGLSAANILEARRGKLLMDKIRTIVTDVANAEVAAIERRTYEVRNASERTRRTLLLLLAAAIAVVGGSSLVMIAHLVARRRAELALADTLARHRAILASAMDAIVTISTKGLIETANPATARVFGWAADELTGQPISLLFERARDGSEAQVLEQLEAFARDGGHTKELTGRRKDGSTLPIDVAVGQMRASDGHRLVAILHDVTERKRAEVMKNEFVSTVSHELRTPLTSIAGSLGLLDGGAAGPLSDSAKRLVGIAHQNSRRLVRLINDILDIEKMQSATVAFAREAVSLADVARQAMEQNAGFAQQHNVRISLRVEDVNTTIVGDQDRLIQVLTNLISNAVKFSPAEGVVDLWVGREGDLVRVSVRDHGTGIPKSFRASIFTRFAQADNSDTRQRGGTGLGLAIAKEIVERHGARLSFETEEGTGTVFHVDFQPLMLNAPAESRSEAAPFLLVQGDAEEAAAILAELAPLGVPMERAHTAAEAEGRASIRSYRAILVAPTLRDRDGISLLRALRRSDRTRTTPLLLVAANAAQRHARAIAVQDWLDTPISRDRLEQIVARLPPNAPSGVLHLCSSAEARRRFAEAARGLIEPVPASTLDDARTALLMRDCALTLLDLSATDISPVEDSVPSPALAQVLAALCAPPGDFPPFLILASREQDALLAREIRRALQSADCATVADWVSALHIDTRPSASGATR